MSKLNHCEVILATHHKIKFPRKEDTYQFKKYKLANLETPLIFATTTKLKPSIYGTRWKSNDGGLFDVGTFNEKKNLDMHKFITIITNTSAILSLHFSIH